MNGQPLLLDTCAFLWIGNGTDLSQAAQGAIVEANENDCLFTSPISAWEIGLLVQRGRLALPSAPLRWFETVLSEGIQLAPLTPQVLIGSSGLPGNLHRDPADRIIAATGRLHDMRVVTRDRALLAYGELGHLSVLAC